MDIGVIYCGGCDPAIDREDLVRRLARELGRPILPLKKMGGRADLVLAVNGCARGCLNSQLFPEWAGKTIAVAGLTIDCWPVSREELIDILAGKVRELACGQSVFRRNPEFRIQNPE